MASGQSYSAPDVAAPRLVHDLVALVLALIWLVGSAVLIQGVGSVTMRAWVGDLSELTMSAAAALAAADAARRSMNRARAAWRALAFGCAAWSLGQAIWSFYELGLGIETPFPSAADAGFLLLPIGAAWCVGLFASQRSRFRAQDVIDGLVLGLTLAAVSWMTALGAVARQSSLSGLARTVALAYPIADVIILTMALLAVMRNEVHRRVLARLATGMAAFAGSDAAFTYFVAVGAFGADNSSGIGWTGGFVIIAITALEYVGLTQPETRTDREGAIANLSGSRPRVRGVTTANPRRTAGSLAFLPYVPLVLAGGVTVALWGAGRAIDTIGTLLLLAAAALTMLRQYVTLLENRRLVTEVAEHQQELERLAYSDPLTGLGNRQWFGQQVTAALHLHQLERRSLAVLFCDLNDFKCVNNGLGPATGDELLTLVAERLRATVGDDGVLARLGGDEFAVLVHAAHEVPVAEAEAMAQRIQCAVGEPFTVGGTTVKTSVSIGTACTGSADPTPTPDDLMAQADIAMYAAKRAMSPGSVHFRPGLTLPEAKDWQLRPLLETAIGEGLLVPHFQPIVELATGRLHGFEALARWQHDGEMIPPGVFIPIAARAGLLPALTRRMLGAALASVVDWASRPGLEHLHVAVNVPAVFFNDPSFPDVVQVVLDELDAPRGLLVLEITEEALFSDLDAAAQVGHTLRDRGVGISLDDFGTGYSSLAHLHELPLDQLKLDRTFVQHVDSDSALRRLLSGVLALTHDLELEVVAEGIDRRLQVRALRELGCRLGQGHLFSPAVAAVQCEQLLGRDLVRSELEPAP